MFKIAHVSDTHLGYSSTRSTVRTQDFYDAWMDACAKIAAEAPDLIIHSGDVFHQPKPPYSAIRSFIEGMKLLDGIPKLIVTGNHETARLRPTVSVFDILDSILENTIISRGFSEESLVYTKDGEPSLGIWAVPWGRLTESIKMDHIKPTTGIRNILVSHGDVPTVAFSNLELGKGCVPSSILDQDWDYIAMGHIHRAYYPWKNACYAGSTERCGWSDLEDEPGFMIIEFEDDRPPAMRHVDIKNRSFVDLGSIDGENLLGSDILDEIKSRLSAETSEAIVRVDLKNVSRSALYETKIGLRRIQGPSEISLRGESSTLIHHELDGENSGKNDIASLFKEFVASRNHPPEFAERFEKRGLELLQSLGDEAVENE